MLKDFLRDVISLVVGKQSEEIADLLYSNKHVNEFLIAKKLGITINQARNLLYKISDQGLVSSIRKKDKKKGWYTYFWKIEVLKSLEFLKDNLLNKIDQISHQIKSREVKQFYFCQNCNVEYTEESALLNDFTCPECGNVFTVKDNSLVLKELRKNLAKLIRELVFVEEELSKEKEKVNKEKAKISKKIEKELKYKKDLKKKERKKQMEKIKRLKIKTKPKKSKKKVIKKPSKKKTLKRLTNKKKKR
jgi:transcription factor E